MASKRMIHTKTPGSTAIERIGYNHLTNELFILFKKKGKYPEYVFGGVQEQTAARFMGARSKGGFYHDHIKANKSFTVSKPLGSFRLGAISRRIRNVFSRR
jgi:hypothetical protein